MLERLENLKLSVQNYLVNYKFPSDFIITAEEWQLLNHIIALIKLFFIVKKECSKNNVLPSSVISLARSLTKYFTFIIVQKKYQLLV